MYNDIYITPILGIERANVVCFLSDVLSINGTVVMGKQRYIIAPYIVLAGIVDSFAS